MTRSCPRCGTPNADGANFCVQCGTLLASACPRCGAATPPEARFCPACGLPLRGDEPAEVDGAPREERRIVTILFADLAGFTERSDRADPEDVRRTLRPFHATAKEVIEGFGGTLDKFIGDAVLGVFGAPVAHEDDPERGVRAALELQARMARRNQADPAQALSVRAAVTTGEAVVTFASGPQVGENVAGDVVNTASRLQAAAPLGGVLVGWPTYRATRSVVAYRALDPVTVKGKAEPLRVWLAERVRGAGSDTEDRGPAFVGRPDERRLLRELFARGVRSRSAQLVTITGDPGIGKSRLVDDLRASLERDGEPVAWHRGRCLSYGEGVTFWAVAEIVKGIAVIRESDGRDRAATKLAAAVASVEDRPAESDWLRARLAPLVGLAEPGDRVERTESFAAWLGFLRAVAERTSMVLVFEDLHWAEPAMLDFVDEAVAGLEAAPVLVVATGRPELFDRRPGWGGGRRNATTISLTGLAAADMATLLDALLSDSTLPTAARDALARTAGGNPLYAREVVRMLADRAAEEGADDPPALESIPVPTSIRSLIASRLDALSPFERALVQDASVVGETFWSGALAAMGQASGSDGLRELERRGLIEPVESSTMAGQAELRFTHALIRDVAYGQIPRAERARRHVAVAAWIQRVAGDRAADRSELVAYHYARALELARATAAPGLDVPGLEDAARDAFVAAADHAAAMDAVNAARLSREALDLTPPGHPARAELLARWATAGWRSGDLSVEETFAPLEEAIAGYLEADDRVAAGAATRRLYYQLAVHGETARASEVLHRARALLEGEPPSPALAEVYVSEADVEMFAGRTPESLAWAEKALALGSLPGAEASAVNALHLRGNARCEVGDPQGLDDLREALRRSEALGDTLSIATSRSFLGEWTWLQEGPAAGLAVTEPAIELLDRRGLVSHARWARAESLAMRFDLGAWDRLTEDADGLLAGEARGGETQAGPALMPHLARVHLMRGRPDRAGDLAERLLPRARGIEDLQVLAPALVAAAVIAERRGERGSALALIEEFDGLTERAPEEYRGVHLPDLVRVVVAAGEPERGRRLVDTSPGWTTRVRLATGTAGAVLDEAEGEVSSAAAAYADAAAGWSAYGMVLEHVLALQGAARCLERLGRGSDARAARSDAAAAGAALGLA